MKRKLEKSNSKGGGTRQSPGASSKKKSWAGLTRGKGSESQREKVLKRAEALIEKRFGKGAIQRLGKDGVKAIPVLPTGSPAVDLALGVGGYPRGRIVEVFGPESSGKTTLALHAIAACQSLGGTCAFVDAEHALDVSYARQLGVCVEDLLVSQPDDGEQALGIVEALVQSADVDLVIVDSVAALVPRAELNGEMGDSHVGLQARLMSQALRKLGVATNQAGAVVLFINQLRHKIGVQFGSPETTTGGRALRFYASVRLDIRRIGGIKRGDTLVGNRTRIKVVKNKVAPPFVTTELEILFGMGFNVVGELLDMGLDRGFIQQSGSWYAMDGQRLGQGRERAVASLREDATGLAKLREQLFAAAGLEHLAVTGCYLGAQAEAGAEHVEVAA